jgi:hypothetical protein
VPCARELSCSSRPSSVGTRERRSTHLRAHGGGCALHGRSCLRRHAVRVRRRCAPVRRELRRHAVRAAEHPRGEAAAAAAVVACGRLAWRALVHRGRKLKETRTPPVASLSVSVGLRG